MLSSKFPLGTRVIVGYRVGFVVPFEDYDCPKTEQDLILDPDSGPYIIVRDYKNHHTTGWNETMVVPYGLGFMIDEPLHTVENKRGFCAECLNDADWTDYLCRRCRAC